MRNNKLIKRLRKKILGEKATGVCYYCGRSFPTRRLTLDHLVPRCKGGKTSEKNLIPACSRCNSYKSSLCYEQFIKNAKVNVKRAMRDQAYWSAIVERSKEFPDVASIRAKRKHR